MEKIIANLEVITPMFLSGGDGKSAELRSPSIKGLLRYWWRALQAEEDLEQLREKEERIFGSVDQGANFSIRIKYEPVKAIKDGFPPHPVPVEGKGFRINILDYLAYGTHEYIKGKGNVFIKERIKEGTKFNLIFNISRKEYKKDILDSFYIFYLFGGMGSRSRNGFGGVEISNASEVFESIKDEFSIDAPYEKQNIEKMIKKIAYRSYSSLSSKTCVFKAKASFDTWDDSLADVGNIYRKSRINLEQRHSFEKRQYIGAPIVEKKVTKSFLDRHAKPYFIRVAKEGVKYRSYILFLPSKYCEGLEKDRNKLQIDHPKVDKEFMNVCKEFNDLLKKEMEPVFSGIADGGTK